MVITAFASLRYISLSLSLRRNADSLHRSISPFLHFSISPTPFLAFAHSQTPFLQSFATPILHSLAHSFSIHSIAIHRFDQPTSLSLSLSLSLSHSFIVVSLSFQGNHNARTHIRTHAWTVSIDTLACIVLIRSNSFSLFHRCIIIISSHSYIARRRLRYQRRFSYSGFDSSSASFSSLSSSILRLLSSSHPSSFFPHYLLSSILLLLSSCRPLRLPPDPCCPTL